MRSGVSGKRAKSRRMRGVLRRCATERHTMSDVAQAARDKARQVLDPLAEFLREEAAGGIALMTTAAAALIWANSPAGDTYFTLWEQDLKLGFGSIAITADLRHWVNDGLMALFFFVVGLEIKRELVVGELRDRRAAVLPAIAALGGVIAPALVFLALAAGGSDASGWAIPAATDIAFAVGVLAVLGDRISSGVKLFLLTIAIVDDIIAIVLIAVFYSGGVSLTWLAAAVAALGAAVVLRRSGVARIAVYVPVGVAAWIAMHESGVHATIAGVALGLLTPARPVGGRPVLSILEHRLHPLSAFVVVPLFALANAGVDFGGGVLTEAATSRLAWAIALGLLVGKLFGIAGGTHLALRKGWGRLPDQVNRRQVWGVAALGGIGFTVSLFIAQLAYEDAATVSTAKVGIFAGSLVSATVGAVVLLIVSGHHGCDAPRSARVTTTLERKEPDERTSHPGGCVEERGCG
jgi:Na+:H+ antiporter, NhaA family